MTVERRALKEALHALRIIRRGRDENEPFPLVALQALRDIHRDFPDLPADLRRLTEAERRIGLEARHDG